MNAVIEQYADRFDEAYFNAALKSRYDDPDYYNELRRLTWLTVLTHAEQVRNEHVKIEWESLLPDSESDGAKLLNAIALYSLTPNQFERQRWADLIVNTMVRNVFDYFSNRVERSVEHYEKYELDNQLELQRADDEYDRLRDEEPHTAY